MKNDIQNQPARQFTYECDIEERQSNQRRRGKAISISHSECLFVLLAIQHAIYACAILYYQLWPAEFVRIFPFFSHKWQDCLFSFSFGVLQYECSTY